MRLYLEIFDLQEYFAQLLQGTYRRGGKGIERVAIKVLKDKPQGGVDQMIREVI